ncbi:MAG: RtcB family protein [Anaerolineae bacterium]|nr:RtcB family protein [Anaerolineae bacterium]
MVRKQDLTRINDNLWEVPKSYREDMRVPARIYANERMLEAALADQAVDQLVNTTTLPGVVGYALAMPDIHQGYGFPIGGVAATALPDGMISPGGVGYDINCGVRLLVSDIDAPDLEPYLNDLATALFKNCPSGVGQGGEVKVKDYDQLLHEGAQWALKKGYARPEDIERTEGKGRFEKADAGYVSAKARKRGADQVGTLGAGNHFIEVDLIEHIYDERAAHAMGLVQGRVAVQIHTGSRGFGHQVADDYIRTFQKAVQKFGVRLPDRQLVCAPLNSDEGRQYLGAMFAAANYAFANRQLLVYHVRRSFEATLAGRLRSWDLRQVYDIAHNIAKIETHEIGGERVKVLVHRKGATRAFGPGFEELPAEYRHVGQPVLVPGSMGTASYVLVGTSESMAQSFGSTCHGAGRTMSRNQAKKTVRGAQLREELEAGGIAVRAGSMAGLAEEAPVAYKDVDSVVQVVHEAGLARKVARLVPLAVMKG